MTTDAPALSLAPPLQPYVHRHVCCVSAPAQWLSPADGDLVSGVDGLYVADRRALSVLRVGMSSATLAPISGGLTGATRARFLAAARGVGDPTPDPTVTVERRRTVGPAGGTEHLTVHNASAVAVRTTLTVTAAADLAPIGDARSGITPERIPPRAIHDGLVWEASDGYRTTLTATGGPSVDAETEAVAWELDVPVGGTWSADLTIAVTPCRQDGFRQVAPAKGHRPLTGLTIRSADPRFARLVERGTEDLAALRMADPDDPSDMYFAAGSPWYLTLFGRDSLWAARMSLALGHHTAAGTLRALARRQGRTVDPATEEQPGRIPHELRPDDTATLLPPVYYGTIDATPLFVSTLAEAWRWGMPDDEVEALLPTVERALAWMADYGDADGDGFIEYIPSGAGGLVNQGWKDSGDGVRYADGGRAEPPLALCEVQGYAHEAAIAGAGLLEHFGRPGADTWRAYAARLAERFRAAFWIADPDGDYPAIALDGDKRPVDGPASNMGHLLGTGLLHRREEELVATRLVGPGLNSGYGLRTLSADTAGFNPLSYHVGSVWPHDTAISAYGLARAGFSSQAAELLLGLLRAAPYFEHRLPELYGGYRAEDGVAPVPYPTACSPQAWAAAVGPLAMSIMLGLDVDLPAGRITIDPPTPPALGAFTVTGLTIGSSRITATVDVDGTVSHSALG